MMRATKIRSLTRSAVGIRPHHRGRALPLPPAELTLARLLTGPRASCGQACGRALVGLLVGMLALLTWPGMPGAWSLPALHQIVTGGAMRPSLALGSGPSPVLSHPGKSATVVWAGRMAAPLASMAPDAADLEYDDPDDDTPSSLAVLTARAWLPPPALAGRGTTGMTPTFSWPFLYLTRPQLLTRL
jgi:hypothetical protein